MIYPTNLSSTFIVNENQDFGLRDLRRVCRKIFIRFSTQEVARLAICRCEAFPEGIIALILLKKVDRNQLPRSMTPRHFFSPSQNTQSSSFKQKSEIGINSQSHMRFAICIKHVTR